MFMHNGGIAQFGLIKRKLQASLVDAAFGMVQGNTGESETYYISISPAFIRF